MNYLILCTRFYVSAGVILLIFSRISAKSLNYRCNIAAKYRSTDAQCNNLQHTHRGTTNSSYLRLLPAEKDELVNKLPPIDKIVRNFLSIQPNFGRPNRWSPNALFLMWTELLRLDLNSPIASNGQTPRNEATAYLDASFLYNNGHPDSLTKIVNGELIYRPCDKCKETSYAKDLIWLLVKEHNRIRDTLKLEYPEWDTRTVFEETRKVLIAEVQHITYTEYLPVLLGKTFAKKYDDENGEAFEDAKQNVYDKSIEAGIYLTVNDVFFEAVQRSALNQNFTDAPQITKKSAAISLMQNSTVNLFNLNPEQIRHILESSRNHKLPFYRNWRKFCVKKSLISETNTSSHLNDNQIFIDLIYGPSSEADLLMGELTEQRALDALLGSTLRCIMRAQFQVIIRGDRFWYSNKNATYSLTENQLSELQRTTLNSLMCTNINDLKVVGENAFSSYHAQSYCSFDGDNLMHFYFEQHPRLFIDLPPNKRENNFRTRMLKVHNLKELDKTISNNLEHGIELKNSYSNRLIECSNLSHLKLTSWKKSHRPVFDDESRIEENLIRKAVRRAEDDLTRRKQTEYLLWSNKGGVDPKSPIGIAAAFSKPNKNALLLANNSILLEYATNELLNSLHRRSFARKKRQLFDGDDSILGISDDLGGDFLQELDIAGFLPDAFKNSENNCPTEVGPCDPNYPYRSYTGYCNNLRKPNYGKSLTTFTRLLPPAYEDGISKPRQRSVMGIALPSPRLVSSMLHLDISHLDSKYSLMLMQFAQFLDHDITFTPVHRGFFASIPDCRPCDSPITVHPECMPIEVPAGDPYYPQINFTSGQRFCLPFMRSLPGQQRLGSREQINQNSAFLDVSQVYGEHACLARQLRSYQGRLNATSSLFGDRELLPQSSLHPECKAPSGYCFIAGDGRASEQPGLTSIHTIFMREHNRLADGLRFVNPHWDDEHLYQQARRILIAEYQHIVYNEFLPRILGHSAMNLYGLTLEPAGQYFKGYSDECNPSVMSEFAAAAFRIGHSLLRPHIPRMSASYQPLEPSILLRDTFFNPDVIYQRQVIDEITRGLLATPVETLDQFITKEITNHLFEDKKIPHSGMDLPALNVQRARDHGIPSYNEYRAMCNLKRATTWEDLSKELPSDVISRLKRVYPTVDDVDLFPAGISERPLPGGRVGPTFGCIIGIQFRQLRNCDRFWYETVHPIIRFSPEQLAEIRKATLSKILCDNFDVPTPVQRLAFDLPHEENPRFPCHSLPGINLKAWKDGGPSCQFGGRILGVGQSYLPTPCTSCVCTPQGARCATIRVTDCNKLIQEAGQEAVLKDEVCSAQCSSFVTIRNGEASTIVDRLPPLTSQGRGIQFYHAAGLRPPPPSSVPRVRNPSTRSFKLRDFAIVVG